MGTPVGIVEKLNQMVNKAQDDPSFKTAIEGMGLRLQKMRPKETEDFLAKESVNWGKYTASAKYKPQ